MDAFSFTKVNAEFPVVHTQPSHAEIVAKLSETEDLSNDNGDVIETEDECLYCPTEVSCWKSRDHAKIILAFKRWCNCLILC